LTVSEASFTDGMNSGNARAVSCVSATRPRIALIWAMARNRVIGNQNTLPWHLPADMRHFRELTTGHPVLMGRKTFESLGRPLPDRTNIVITTDRHYATQGCIVAHSLDEALTLAASHVSPNNSEIFVIGGEQLYTQMLCHADRLYMTQVETDAEGDAWFPEFDLGSWNEIQRDLHPADDKNTYPCTFLTLERKSPRQ